MHILRQATFEIIRQIRYTDNPIEICRHIENHRRSTGYDAFCSGYLPRSSKHDLCDGEMILGWPAEWKRRYETQGYIHLDPVLKHVRGLLDSPTSPEAIETGATSDDGIVIVIGSVRTIPLDEGFRILLHLSNGGEACISFVAERPDCSSEGRDALHFVAVYATSMARVLAHRRFKAGPDRHPGQPLTTREIECLRLAADGQTAREISKRLLISRRTVEHHLAAASCKLQTVSRAHCIAEALRRRIIC